LDIYEIIKQQFLKRSEKQLGLMSFYARVYSSDKCGSNGLPLIPNSIRIYGKFQYLKSLTHKNLCRYVQIQRGAHERLFIVSEHYTLNLNDLLNDTYIYNLIMANSTIQLKWCHQMLKALTCLSLNSIVHRCLHLKHVCVTPNGNLKLNNYGLFHMSECGFCVNFPVCNLVTLAPECLVLEYLYGNKFGEYPVNNNEQNVELNNSKCDVWSLGVVLFQFLFGLSSQTESTQENLNKLLTSERIISNALDLLLDENKTDDMGYKYMIKLYNIEPEKLKSLEQRIKPVLLQLIKKCLIVDCSERPDFQSLLEFFESNSVHELPQLSMERKRSISQIQFLNGDLDLSAEHSIESIKLKLFTSKIRSSYLPNNKKSLIDINKVSFDLYEKEDTEEDIEQDHLWKRGVDEVFYLWKLAGGDFLQTLKQNGRLTNRLMPIEKMPLYITVDEGREYGRPCDEETLFDETIVPLSLTNLRNRLNLLKPETFYPIIEKCETTPSENILSNNDEEEKINLRKRSYNRLNNLSADMIETTQKQPINIRENDIEYQFHRIVLFSRYLVGYPFKKNELFKECRIDIPPLYRSLAWAALLDVRCDIGKVYSGINKEIITATDRQIDVDIPRCHQYGKQCFHF
jgi:TBC domain-containing protein kinase-like protein